MSRGVSAVRSMQGLGLFWGEVGHDDAVDTGVQGISHEGFLTIAKHRIVIGHEDERDINVTAQFTDHVRGFCAASSPPARPVATHVG